MFQKQIFQFFTFLETLDFSSIHPSTSTLNKRNKEKTHHNFHKKIKRKKKYFSKLPSVTTIITQGEKGN